jgi:hypothetical protein
MKETNGRKFKLMAGAAFALTAYAAYEYTKKRKREKEMEKNFVWISSELSSSGNEDLPMFYEGDEVHIFNPYTEMLEGDEFDQSPPLYRITDVLFDYEDEMHRYKLEGRTGWISEDWLSLPLFPKYSKTLADMPEIAESIEEQVEELERSILYKTMEDELEQTNINALLSALSWALEHGTEEEVEEYKQQLRYMTEDMPEEDMPEGGD